MDIKQERGIHNGLLEVIEEIENFDYADRTV
jgi:hypothetical protein